MERQNISTHKTCLSNKRRTIVKQYSQTRNQQQLSYRKQIARQLRTQYGQGIHRPKYYTVTLKSRLMVTQGHWKLDHWTDHTRLTIIRVI